jgi:hypothetical protein
MELCWRPRQHLKGKALAALGADSWQFLEVIDDH